MALSFRYRYDFVLIENETESLFVDSKMIANKKVILYLGKLDVARGPCILLTDPNGVASLMDYRPRPTIRESNSQKLATP
jgi:hypothetical protein